MKSFLKNLVLKYVSALARIRLKRLSPFIIAVTGSVGKTSIKDAIFTLLSKRYRIIRNEKSYNSDFGLPLAILEQTSGFSSPFLWLKILAVSFFKAFFGGHHLQMMVLELGVDKPGDMDTLLKVIKPHLAVLSSIRPVHLAEGQFKDLDDIFEEKSKLILALPSKGTAILNADDGYVCRLKDRLLCKTIWYGQAEWADLQATDIQNEDGGISFTLRYQEQVVAGKFILPGTFQVYTLLPAIAAGLLHGFSLEEAVSALKDYRLPPGRMNFIPGIKGSTLIDSSYNASPESMKAALDVLQDRAQGKRIAVLGNMNELGHMTEYYHEEIGKYVVGKADALVTIGDLARHIASSAREHGFSPDNISSFDKPEEAFYSLRGFVEKGDTVLIKGSQNRVRLERLVKMLMDDKLAADHVLVRQEKQWDDIE